MLYDFNMYKLFIIFSYRNILASLHFNENIKRETKKTNTGNSYYRVTYPKFKFGEEVVREVPVPPTYSKKTFLLGHKN